MMHKGYKRPAQQRLLLATSLPNKELRPDWRTKSLQLGPNGRTKRLNAVQGKVKQW